MQQFPLIICRGKLKKLCITSPVLYVYPVLNLTMLFAQSSKIPLEKVSYPDIQLINVSYMQSVIKRIYTIRSSQIDCCILLCTINLLCFLLFLSEVHEQWYCINSGPLSGERRKMSSFTQVSRKSIYFILWDVMLLCLFIPYWGVCLIVWIEQLIV